MAEADAKDRDAAEEFLNVFDGVPDRFGVAGAIRKENAVRLEIENVLGRRLRGDDPGFAVMVHEQTENVLLNAEVVGHNTQFARVRNSAGFAHGFRPGRNGELDRAFYPAVGLFATDMAGEFLAGHRRQLFGLENQLLCGRAVSGNDSTHGADIANVAYERACVDIPNSGNFVAIQIELRGFRGAPVRRDLRKLAHDERFDVRARRLFVVEIGADVPDVRICQANDLPCVTGICKDFLITREAGIENDFAAAARDSASSAPVKDAPVFQSERGGPVRNFGQMVLPVWSSKYAGYVVCGHFLVLASVV